MIWYFLKEFKTRIDLFGFYSAVKTRLRKKSEDRLTHLDYYEHDNSPESLLVYLARK